MNTNFIKAIFFIFSITIFFYCFSYIKFEIKTKKNNAGGITLFILLLFSLIFGNIMFFTA